MVHWCTDLSSFSTEAPQPCGIPGLVCRAKWPGQRGVPGLFLRDRQFQQFQQFQRVINIFAYKCAYIYIQYIYIYNIYIYIYIHINVIVIKDKPEESSLDLKKNLPLEEEEEMAP